MKLAINLNTKKIVDILPNNATDSHKFLVNNGYRLIELDIPYNDDGTFRELTDTDLKPFLLESANSEYEKEIINLGITIPDKEEATFPIQRAEALAWDKDNSSPTPFIDGMLETREKYQNDKAGLIAKIIAKSNYYSYEVGKKTGSRQDIEDKLEG